MRIWLTIFVCWPAPGPPWWIHFEPIVFQIGSRAATVSASPPIMIESVALRAPTSPPETGASMLTTSALGGLLGNLHRQRRLARRHVDQNAARFAAGQRAVVRQQHLADVVRKADDRNDDVRRGRHVARRSGPSGAASPSARPLSTWCA